MLLIITTRSCTTTSLIFVTLYSLRHSPRKKKITSRTIKRIAYHVQTKPRLFPRSHFLRQTKRFNTLSTESLTLQEVTAVGTMLSKHGMFLGVSQVFAVRTKQCQAIAKRWHSSSCSPVNQETMARWATILFMQSILY